MGRLSIRGEATGRNLGRPTWGWQKPSDPSHRPGSALGRFCRPVPESRYVVAVAELNFSWFSFPNFGSESLLPADHLKKDMRTLRTYNNVFNRRLLSRRYLPIALLSGHFP